MAGVSVECFLKCQRWLIPLEGVLNRASKENLHLESNLSFGSSGSTQDEVNSGSSGSTFSKVLAAWANQSSVGLEYKRLLALMKLPTVTSSESAATHSGSSFANNGKNIKPGNGNVPTSNTAGSSSASCGVTLGEMVMPRAWLAFSGFAQFWHGGNVCTFCPSDDEEEMNEMHRTSRSHTYLFRTKVFLVKLVEGVNILSIVFFEESSQSAEPLWFALDTTRLISLSLCPASPHCVVPSVSLRFPGIDLRLHKSLNNPCKSDKETLLHFTDFLSTFHLTQRSSLQTFLSQHARPVSLRTLDDFSHLRSTIRSSLLTSTASHILSLRAHALSGSLSLHLRGLGPANSENRFSVPRPADATPGQDDLSRRTKPRDTEVTSGDEGDKNGEKNGVETEISERKNLLELELERALLAGSGAGG